MFRLILLSLCIVMISAANPPLTRQKSQIKKDPAEVKYGLTIATVTVTSTSTTTSTTTCTQSTTACAGRRRRDILKMLQEQEQISPSRVLSVEPTLPANIGGGRNDHGDVSNLEGSININVDGQAARNPSMLRAQKRVSSSVSPVKKIENRDGLLFKTSTVTVVAFDFSVTTVTSSPGCSYSGSGFGQCPASG